MLKAINVGTRSRQASSLYCVWIKSADGDAPVIAIWIDPEMRAFTGELAAGADCTVIPRHHAKNGELPAERSECQPTADEER